MNFFSEPCDPLPDEFQNQSKVSGSLQLGGGFLFWQGKKIITFQGNTTFHIFYRIPMTICWIVEFSEN